MNPLAKSSSSYNTLKEGNLHLEATGQGSVMSTFAISAGKWYWECLVTIEPTWWPVVGFSKTTSNHARYGNQNWTGEQTGSWGYLTEDGKWYVDGSVVATYTGVSAGDILQFALDMDAGKAWVGINDTWVNSGAPASGTNAIVTSGLTGDITPAFSDSDGAGHDLVANFGQDSSFAGAKTAQGNSDSGDATTDFYYTPPTNFLALCTDNLSDPEIVLPEPYFDILTGTGDGTSSKTYSGLEFQPDLIIAKDYYGSADDNDWQFMDVVRGADQILRSNNNSQSYDGSTSFGGGSLRTFTSDGFTVVEGTSNNNNLNDADDLIIAYNWLAGGTGVANTTGSINSTVSANTTSGFAIVTFTSNATAGATVGHGLSQAPEMILTKRTDSAQSWYSGATSMADSSPWHYTFEVNGHSSWNARDEEWNDTTPGASVFTLGQHGSNTGTNPIVAYCWHSVEGYSKIGHYFGNGNADGPMVYTGFRPSFVMLKGNGVNLHHHVLDNKRWTYNPVGITNGAPGISFDDHEVPENEGSGFIDFLSNGFKIRNNNGNDNNNATRFIYLAFAESPFKTSNAR
jgi:hypothetical protein